VRIFPRIRLPRHKERKLAGIHRASRSRGAQKPGSIRSLDLCSVVGSASSVESLYEALVSAIGYTFLTPAVSLFIRDDDAGDFPCCASTVVSSDPKLRVPCNLTFSADSFLIRRLNHLNFPLRVDDADLTAWKNALIDAPGQVLERRMQEKDVILQTRSRLFVQLKTKGDLLGVLSLGEGPADRLSSEDREMLNGVASQLALVIENTKLLRRLVEHERLRAELAVAAEVQRTLLPAAGPALAGIDLCGFCQPASQVGGDYYDFVLLGDNRVGICIADVAGKGISAALLMSVVQASLRSQLFNTQEPGSAKNVVTMLNRLICRAVSAARYVTCFYGQLDARNGRFRFVNAGHNPPLLIRRSFSDAHGADAAASLESLSSGGPVLGMFPDCSFEESEVLLHSGDILVAYTDGVTEAMDVFEEEFSEVRLHAAVTDASHLSAKEILVHIISRVAEWSKGASQHDDITVVVLKASEPSNGSNGCYNQ
jgi:serine phosphatase RsbU (regulator of sigma subunit)